MADDKADDKLDEAKVLRTMTEAVELQLRSAVELAYVAGTLTGMQWVVLGETLSRFATVELDGARRLIEKMVALGGRPPTTMRAPSPPPRTPGTTVRVLVEHEEEALAALHAVIPHSGQEPRSEALEHLLEHLLLRKQSQVDTMRRALADE